MNPEHTPVSLILVNKEGYVASVKNLLATVTPEKYSLVKDLSFEFVYSTSGVFVSIVKRKSGEPPLILTEVLSLPVFLSEKFPREVFTSFTVSAAIFLEPEKTMLPDFYRHIFENYFQITDTQIRLVKKQAGARVGVLEYIVYISFQVRDSITGNIFHVNESCSFYSKHADKHLVRKTKP